MASSSPTSITIQQNLLSSSVTLCKYQSLPFPTFSNFHFLSFSPIFSRPKHPPQLNLSKPLVVKAQDSSHTAHKSFSSLSKTSSLEPVQENTTEFASLSSRNERVVENSIKNLNISVMEESDTRKNPGFRKRRRIDSGNSSVESREKNSVSDKISQRVISSSMGKDYENHVKEFKTNDQVPLRLKLDMFSKSGDVMGAIRIYDWAEKEGVKMEQYHYSVILYLCSSAALGAVQPAKSGIGNRTLNLFESQKNQTSTEKKDLNSNSHSLEEQKILVSEDFKKYALQRGFEIYEKMCFDKIPMNEATLTSLARMAMSIGNGEMAFDMVKKMKPLGINPKLRSYGPALMAFCNDGDVDKAFLVEKHMLEHGVYPEEPELEALLKVSIKAGKPEKVYYLLHKLRTSVRQVSKSTANLIVTWFTSKAASMIGKEKWDQGRVKNAMENRGGGWHGLGWLGKGKWSVSLSIVGEDGLCKCCGEKLVTIDLDPIETENFAKSVASIAAKREKNSSFQKFQKWLDYYGPVEVVIDAANVGLYSQRKFIPAKVNLVVNGIRQKLPSRKWPLIVLHNKRITGRKMEAPVNRAFIEKWKNADALYATPTGSNDDWYWLYAAIKFKCLIVTNDEMRDHTFQLLGNDFFPKWKERHQVRFSFSDSGPLFHMPPPCSVVIQESEKGHWHIPIILENSYESEREWLCITRPSSKIARPEDRKSLLLKEGNVNNDSADKHRHGTLLDHSKSETTTRNSPQKNYRNLKKILSESVFSKDYCTLFSEIEEAEKLGGCTIDFQI